MNLDKVFELLVESIFFIMLATTILAALFGFIGASSDIASEVNKGTGYKTAGFFTVSNMNGELGFQSFSELNSRIDSCSINEQGLTEDGKLSVGAGKPNCITKVGGAESLSLESIMYSEQKGFYPVNVELTYKVERLRGK
ncbi:MAG: hypothetical protein ABEK16_03665 [Candidatus Nanohalobium sp.]